MALWHPLRRKDAKKELNPNQDVYARFDRVKLTLGNRQVLSDVSLSLSEKRIGVVGLNGSGKSSFVRLVNGLRRADSGTVKVFGSDIDDVAADLPRFVGFVFQNPDHQAIFPTVGEEIAFGLRQLGFDKAKARDDALRFLELHSCSALVDKPFAELSEGQKQLICILAVLVMEPKVLILDEPMASLDGLAGRKIMQKLKKLDQKLLMISHDLSFLADFDRILWLEDGSIRMDSVPGDVLPAFRADVERRSALELGGDDL
ncbi:biotin transport system ATP-binding protein [Roseibium hamelinense]|uniref:Biotin transport system ATP-binding protein n=1 Tax=Roseibium hamelinense TaxID=150831 RepID=A0A562SNQ7_9HYPH|nr:ABC transporter ATP-binding protein [Roseibium hamelinense]MTI44266.1 ABC transporter ATP-binding protein [Roseibium hamelinense]TWI82961.1 biotin transport system ATP-binding protein [Roseibium hamelinense]